MISLIIMFCLSRAFAEAALEPMNVILHLELSSWGAQVPGGEQNEEELRKLNPQSAIKRGVLERDPQAKRILSQIPNGRVRGLVLEGAFDFKDWQIEDLLLALRPKLADQLSIVVLTSRPRIKSSSQASRVAEELLNTAGVDGTVYTASPQLYEPPEGAYAPAFSRLAVSILGGASLALVMENYCDPAFLVHGLGLSAACMALGKAVNHYRGKDKSAGKPKLPWWSHLSAAAPIGVADLWPDANIHIDLSSGSMIALAGAGMVDNGLRRAYRYKHRREWDERSRTGFYNRGWKVYVKHGETKNVELVPLTEPDRIFACEQDLLAGQPYID